MSVKRNVDLDRLTENLLRRFEQHMLLMMVLCDTSYRDSKYATKATDQLLDQLRKSSDDILDEVVDFLKISGHSSKLSKLNTTVKNKSDNTSATIIQRLTSKLTRFHVLLFKEIEQARNNAGTVLTKDAEEHKLLREQVRTQVQNEFVDEFCDTMASTSIGTRIKNLVSKKKQEPAMEQCVSDLHAGFQAYLDDIRLYNQGVFAPDDDKWMAKLDMSDGSDKTKKNLDDWRTSPKRLAASLAQWILVSI
jgi:hypothetical protein